MTKRTNSVNREPAMIGALTLSGIIRLCDDHPKKC